jgi:plasmid stability protein
MQLSIRGCPDQVHQALKRRAQSNRRSLNNELLVSLEREAQAEKPVTGAEWAARLRKARKILTEKEHSQLAEDIEAGRKLMNREHLR